MDGGVRKVQESKRKTTAGSIAECSVTYLRPPLVAVRLCSCTKWLVTLARLCTAALLCVTVKLCLPCRINHAKQFKHGASVVPVLAQCSLLLPQIHTVYSRPTPYRCSFPNASIGARPRMDGRYSRLSIRANYGGQNTSFLGLQLPKYSS